MSGSRQIFENIETMCNYVQNNPILASKKTPWEVHDEYGNTLYTLASNGDQAIAAVARGCGYTVKTVPLGTMFPKVG